MYHFKNVLTWTIGGSIIDVVLRWSRVCSSAIWSSLQLWHEMDFSINIKQIQGKARTIKRPLSWGGALGPTDAVWSVWKGMFYAYCLYNLFIHTLVLWTPVSFVCLFSFITKLISVCNVWTKITHTALARTRFNPFKCCLSHSMKLML